MKIHLFNIAPAYMSESDFSDSDIFAKEHVVLKKSEKYLVQAGSGKGKTSLLNFIYGCSNQYTGEIHYDDTGATVPNRTNLWKLKLSYVFQDFKLFPTLSVYDNIQLKNKLTHYKSDQEILDLIAKVGLYSKRKEIVKNLSWGQRQRIAVIRALCQPFDFLLLDEPFSHLDNVNIQILTEIIEKELKEQNAGMILTSLELSHHFDKFYKL